MDRRLVLAVMLGILAAGGCRAQQAGPAPAPAFDSIVTVEVADAGLRGRLYAPAGEARRPAILLIGGSEGGVGFSRTGPALARQGYAAFALAYWRAEGLPPTLENIPLEYFEQALAWMAARPEVDPERIGVIGVSRGSEAALLTASRNPTIRAVAAVAPSNVAWQGFVPDRPGAGGAAWTLGGKPLPYRTPGVFGPAGGAEIAAERINGPILLISGRADAVWHADEMARSIAGRLRRAGFPHAVEHLSYARAGHQVLVAEPERPLDPGALERMKDAGGTRDGNAAAWRDSWPRTLAFFAEGLKAPDGAAN